MTEIAVIGSGPAGLMAALRANELGHDVTVFEASPSIGGMSASFETVSYTHLTLPTIYSV